MQSRKVGEKVKGFVVGKMIFIFIYFGFVMFYITAEVRNPCWVSYIRGIGTACFTLALIKNIVDIVRKKSDDT